MRRETNGKDDVQKNEKKVRLAEEKQQLGRYRAPIHVF